MRNFAIGAALLDEESGDEKIMENETP